MSANNSETMDSSSNLQREKISVVAGLAATSVSGKFTNEKGEQDPFSLVWGAYKRQSAGVISDAKRKEMYLKPSVRKKLKSELARKKRNKRNRNFGKFGR